MTLSGNQNMLQKKAKQKNPTQTQKPNENQTF